MCALLQLTVREYRRLRSTIFRMDREDCHASPAGGLLWRVTTTRKEASRLAAPAQAHFRWETRQHSPENAPLARLTARRSVKQPVRHFAECCHRVTGRRPPARSTRALLTNRKMEEEAARGRSPAATASPRC